MFRASFNTKKDIMFSDINFSSLFITREKKSCSVYLKISSRLKEQSSVNAVKLWIISDNEMKFDGEYYNISQDKVVTPIHDFKIDIRLPFTSSYKYNSGSLEGEIYPIDVTRSSSLRTGDIIIEPLLDLIVIKLSTSGLESFPDSFIIGKFLPRVLTCDKDLVYSPLYKIPNGTVYKLKDPQIDLSITTN